MTRKILAISVALAIGWWSSQPIEAQTTGVFACSGGPRDGQVCSSDDDCFVSCPSSFGACVVVQGVCDGGTFDGFPCDCPGGTCVGTGTTGTCQGGAFAGDPCRPVDGEGNCGAGRSCVGTQRICLSGSFRGFGCLRSAHCEGATCGSTGRFCDGGDFADFSCVVSADCSLPTPETSPGVCRTPDFGCPAVSPTFTPSPRFTATRTPVPPTVPRSPTPSATPRPGSPTTTAPRLTPTPNQTAGVGSPTPTIPNSAVLAEPAAKGAAILVVASPENVELTGTITRIGEQRVCTKFIRRPGSSELAINPALSEDAPAGTVLVFGPCAVRQEFVQESCAVGPAGYTGQSSLVWWAALGVLMFRQLRGRKRRQEQRR